MKSLWFLLILISFTFFNSCDKDNVTDANKNKRISLSELGNENYNPEYTAYLNAFNWNDVTAYMSVKKTYINERDDNNQIYQAESYDSFARFYGTDLETPIEMGSISIGEYGLRNVDNFYYQLYENDHPNMILNYGTGTNNINVTDNEGNILIDTNINFYEPIMLTNFNSYQNFSRASDFTLTWSGGSGGIVQTRLQVPSDSLNSDSSAIGKLLGVNYSFIPNTGNLNFGKLDSSLVNGRKHLYLTKLEIQMLNMTNGKKLAMFIYSTYQSSINITN